MDWKPNASMDWKPNAHKVPRPGLDPRTSVVQSERTTAALTCLPKGNASSGGSIQASLYSTGNAAYMEEGSPCPVWGSTFNMFKMLFY